MPNIEIPAGVYSAPTGASKTAQYREVNLVRWEEGKLSPVGGWEQLSYSAPASRIRRIHRWSDNTGVEWHAFLCEGHIYVDSGDGVLTDISPVPALTPPFDNALVGGYGNYLYNFDTYGTPRPEREAIKIIAPMYTLGNWGEDLLIMSSADGRLLRWSPKSPNSKATKVPTSPTGRTFVVTPERHVIVFSVDGQLNRFRWCDQENIENWDIANIESKAGEFDVEPSAPIVSAQMTKGGVLFHTTAHPYMIRFVGLPFVYSYDRLSGGTTPISGGAIVDTAVGAIWMSNSGFWVYNGSSIAPLPCSVWNWIMGDYGEIWSKFEASAVVFESHSEVWFFFVDEGGRENSKYVIYNYRENWWSMGKLSRTCGVSSTYNTFPILSDGLKVYKHESGKMYGGVAEKPWAETFTMNVGGGAGMLTVDRALPDVGGEANKLSFRLSYTMQRSTNSDKPIDLKYTEFKKMRPDGYLDFRTTARDVRLRVDAEEDANWTFGNFFVDFKVRGAR